MSFFDTSTNSSLRVPYYIDVMINNGFSKEAKVVIKVLCQEKGNGD